MLTQDTKGIARGVCFACVVILSYILGDTSIPLWIIFILGAFMGLGAHIGWLEVDHDNK